MALLAGYMESMSLRAFCREYAKQFDDGNAAALADWLLAACLDGHLEPERFSLERGSSLSSNQQELAPEQLSDVLRYMGNNHWLRLPGGGVAPMVEGKDPSEPWLDVVGDHLIVSRDLAMKFAGHRGLPRPRWWSKVEPSDEADRRRARPHSYDNEDEELIREMKVAMAGDPNLTEWDAAGEAAERAQGKGSSDSRRRRLVRKYKERL